MFSANITPELLKLCNFTKVKVFFLVLVYDFNFDLFEFAAAILEKGLFSPKNEQKKYHYRSNVTQCSWLSQWFCSEHYLFSSVQISYRTSSVARGEVGHLIHSTNWIILTAVTVTQRITRSRLVDLGQCSVK